MTDPLAYHITWTTYGSWLPGDARGWVKRGGGLREPDADLELSVEAGMQGEPVRLDSGQREIVARTVREYCRIRDWVLHALNPRTKHVHVVVSARVQPERVLDQLKAWCSRKLNEATVNPPTKWWTYHGSTKYIWDEKYPREAIDYVLERQ
jgi:hypothetical protein